MICEKIQDNVIRPRPKKRVKNPIRTYENKKVKVTTWLRGSWCKPNPVPGAGRKEKVVTIVVNNCKVEQYDNGYALLSFNDPFSMKDVQVLRGMNNYQILDSTKPDYGIIGFEGLTDRPKRKKIDKKAAKPKFNPNVDDAQQGALPILGGAIAMKFGALQVGEPGGLIGGIDWGMGTNQYKIPELAVGNNQYKIPELAVGNTQSLPIAVEVAKHVYDKTIQETIKKEALTSKFKYV